MHSYITGLNRLTNTDETSRVTRKWHLFDAKNVPMGRMAQQIAQLLMVRAVCVCVCVCLCV
jgi:ribosomal protein L13